MRFIVFATAWMFALSVTPLLATPVSPVLSFGPVAVGQRATIITAVRADSTPITITNIWSSDRRFSLRHSGTPATIQPGEHFEIAVTFEPSDERYAQCEFVVESSAGTMSFYAWGGEYGLRDSNGIAVVNPKGGERLEPGDTIAIEWRGTLPTDHVRLLYSIDGGQQWGVITERAMGLVHKWIAPNTMTSSAVIRAELWEPDHVERVRDLAAHRGPLAGIDYTPDGRYLITSEQRPGHPTNSDVFLWNASTLQRSLQFSFPSRQVTAVRSSADSKNIAIAGLAVRTGDTSVRIVNLATQTAVQMFSGHQQGAVGVAWSRDGRTVAVGGLDRLLKVWDVATRRNLFSSDTLDGSVNVIDFEPRGQRLLTGTPSSAGIQIWNLSDGSVRRTIYADSLNRQYGPIRDALYSRDGARVLAATDRQGIVVVDPETGREHFRHVMRAGIVPHATFDMSARLIVGGGDTVHVWDSFTGRELLRLPESTLGLTHVAMSPDGVDIVTSAADRKPRVWTLQGRTIASGQMHRAFGIGAVSSINQPQTSSNLSIAFEPGTLELNRGTEHPMNVHLVIADVHGRTVLRDDRLSLDGSAVTRIDISHLRAGLYVAHVRAHNGLTSAAVGVVAERR